jgi:hypothetical protein
MKKATIALSLSLFVLAAGYASERVANAYKAVKLSTTSVLVSCNDEREPVVQKFENQTYITVTCKAR